MAPAALARIMCGCADAAIYGGAVGGVKGSGGGGGGTGGAGGWSCDHRSRRTRPCIVFVDLFRMGSFCKSAT
jgi:hypothetical protein